MNKKVVAVFVSVLLLFNAIAMASHCLVGVAQVHVTTWTTSNTVGSETSSVADDYVKPELVPGEFILKLKSSISLGRVNGIVTTGIRHVDKLNRRFKVTEMKRFLPNIYKLKLPEEVDVTSIVEEYETNSNVEYAEPNYIYHTFVVPNDAEYTQQWAHQNMQSELAWDIETGNPSVVIAVVDTGLDWDHPDLATNIWTNLGEIPDNSIDDDNNGYVDDVRGWDFVDVPPELLWMGDPDEDLTVRDNDPMDCQGHGTHCSGIVAAVTNNSIGIAGTCWNSKIMAVRTGWKTIAGGGNLLSADSAAAIVYAADNGADVISMSWGAYGISNLIKDAVDYAYAKGVVLVAAAGNENISDKLYPAGYDNVIAIAATDINDAKAGFSNYGTWIDVAAPGVSILSTMFNDTYASWQGTSMSTPFVAGLAGLILSKNPTFTNEEVRNVLRSTTDSIISSEYIGLGRINAYKAVQRNSILIANLHSILDDATVGGIVKITGTANGTNFQGYTVEYGSGIYPTSWTKIGLIHTTPVINNTLAVWNTASITDGVYTIRLRANDAYGQTTQDMTVVKIDTHLYSPLEAWTMFHHDRWHTGYSTSPAPEINATRWSHTTGAEIYSSPTVADGMVFVGSRDDKVYAFNGTTGAIKWSFTTGADVDSSPAVADSMVFIGSYDGKIYAFNETDGALIWNFTTGGNIRFSSPAVVDDMVFIGAMDGKLYALNKVTGMLLWNFTTGGFVDSSPAVADGMVFIGSSDSTVYALNETTGTQIWSFADLGISQSFSSPAVADGMVFIGGSWGKVYALNETDGTQIWSHKPGSALSSSLAVAHRRVFIGTRDNKVYALDETTGTPIWNFATGGFVDSSPAVADGMVFVGSLDGRVYALDEATGSSVWSYQTGGDVFSSPAVADCMVFIGSTDGKIYAFGMRDVAVASLVASPLDVNQGDSVTVEVGVENLGSYTETFGMTAYANTTIIGFTRFTLPPVTSTTFTFSWDTTTFHAGTYRISAKVNVLPHETNTTDNTYADGSVTVRFRILPWSMFRHDRRHSGYSKSTAPKTNATRWICNIGAEVYSSPTVVYGMVFVGSEDGNVYALSEATGELKWSYNMTGSPFLLLSSPSVANGKVFMCAGKSVYVLNAFTGKRIWSYVTGGSVDWCSPVVADGMVFIGSMDGYIYAFNETNGEVIWRYGAGSLQSSPAVADGMVFMGSNDGRVYALNEFTGDLIWTYAARLWIRSSPAVADGMVFIGSVDNNVYTLNETNGELIWSYRTGSTVDSSPAVADGMVFVGSLDDNVYALNETNGELIWSYRTGDWVMSSPAVADGVVFVGSGGPFSWDSNVYALNKTNGALLWSYQTGGTVYSSPAVADGIVFVGSEDGNVYAFGKPAIPGDINVDGLVDIEDVVIATLAFGSKAVDDLRTPWDETARWNPVADLNNDGIIDIVDLVTIGVNFGKTR